MHGNRVHIADTMLISAVRYALPRMTYITDQTVDEVIRVWGDLSDNTQTVIDRDVREAVTTPILGWQAYDKKPWQRLLAFIDNQGGAGHE